MADMAQYSAIIGIAINKFVLSFYSFRGFHIFFKRNAILINAIEINVDYIEGFLISQSLKEHSWL